MNQYRWGIHVVDLIEFGYQLIKFIRILIYLLQGKCLCGQYIRARLRRAGVLNRKVTQRLRNILEPSSHVVYEVFPALNTVSGHTMFNIMGFLFIFPFVFRIDGGRTGAYASTCLHKHIAAIIPCAIRRTRRQRYGAHATQSGCQRSIPYKHYVGQNNFHILGMRWLCHRLCTPGALRLLAVPGRWPG